MTPGIRLDSILLSLVLAQGVAAAPGAIPPGFVDERVVTTPVSNPTAIDFARGGRLFVAFKSGLVLLYQEGQLLPEPFIDLSSEVNTFGDRGLLGLAVHPRFPDLPYVYLLYTHDPDGLPGALGDADGPDGQGARVSRLLRVTADEQRGFGRARDDDRVVLVGTNSVLDWIGDPSGHDGLASCDDGGDPERLGTPVVDCIPSDGPSHSIGTVRFGNDETLFLGSGDGARWVNVDPRALRTLDLDSLAGKILRVDPLTGEGLPDNPFFDGDAASNRSRVWSYGLRNPFRFAIHPVTGELWIGDVGWRLWEEIDTGRGANFGWPCFEGGHLENLAQPGYANDPRTVSECESLDASESVVAPVYAYSRDGRGTAIIVGDFYTGSAYPEPYRGALFFGDFDRQIIRVATLDDGGGVASVAEFATEVGGIVQMIRGPDSNLYYVLLGARNEIRRIRYAGGENHAPVAVARADPQEGDPPLLVSFSGTASYDADAEPLEFAWELGDGATANGAKAVHTYPEPGLWHVTLTVTDGAGAKGRDELWIVVGDTAPVPTILEPLEGRSYRVGDVIELRGRAFDHQEGEVPPERLRWDGILHHNDHAHPDAFTAAGSSASLIIDDHGDGTWLEVRLTATDFGGLSRTEMIELRPSEVLCTITTDPAGLQIVWEGVGRTTPFSIRSTVSGERQIIAPAIQDGLTFDRWSDGMDRAHRIRVGSTDETWTATYRNDPPVVKLDVVEEDDPPALTVTLDASASIDPEGSQLQFTWNLGDGSTATGAVVTHTYSELGRYRVVVRVEDARGAVRESVRYVGLPPTRRRPANHQ